MKSHASLSLFHAQNASAFLHSSLEITGLRQFVSFEAENMNSSVGKGVGGEVCFCKRSSKKIG